MRRRPILRAALLSAMAFSSLACAAGYRNVPLFRSITHVQPMTGLVLWADNPKNKTDAISLEFSYVRYDEVVVGDNGRNDWSKIDALLTGAASRGHQMILRFYDAYPGQASAVPKYIKKRSDYHETQGTSEGQPTGFADWNNATWKAFVLDFYGKFAARYDNDSRLAFLECGFGLWAEYHIYDGPFELGKTFPDKAFQTTFAQRMSSAFAKTHWMISVDAADPDVTPFKGNTSLLALKFGCFDDSFLAKVHAQENEPNWNTMDRSRWQRAPAGGEISYYTKWDQRHALDPTGPHNESFESAAGRFHIAFMFANDQPDYVPMTRIREASLATGYRLKVLKCVGNGKRTKLTVTNAGIAPIYYDAFFAIGNVRAKESLKGLLPGAMLETTIETAPAPARLRIVSERLVAGQSIEFEANLR